ncbi:MAG: hypothetical protein MI924_18715, partial [Chloroflexales bacterium]|nr:hypothetical protein [Chloroflexales bacterium]
APAPVRGRGHRPADPARVAAFHIWAGAQRQIELIRHRVRRCLPAPCGQVIQCQDVAVGAERPARQSEAPTRARHTGELDSEGRRLIPANARWIVAYTVL